MRYRSIVAICTGVVALAWGCGSADEHPFGGPYGGGGNVAPPTNGTSQTQEGTVPDDGTGAPGTTTDAGTTTTKDSGTATPRDSGTTTQPQTPTWSSIYSKYLAAGTPGNCKSSCHSQMGTATKAYTWLQGKGYISGASSPLIDPNQSCLTWYGGNMPPSGGPTSLPAAKTDMAAWAAAGAPNN